MEYQGDGHVIIHLWHEAEKHKHSEKQSILKLLRLPYESFALN